jgi:hypothetical protein
MLTVMSWFKKFSIWHLAFGILVLWPFVRYGHMYWVHMAKEYPYSSQYGVKELVSYVKENQDKYKNIVVSDRYDQPYILFLFYGAADGILRFPPASFQSSHSLTSRDRFGFSTVREFDKYVFISINNWDEVRSKYPNSLIAGTEEEIPKEANIIKDIYGTNGFKYFRIVAN